MRRKKRTEPSPDGQMSLSGHLRELRNRILVCVVVLVAAVLLGLRYAPQLVELLLSMGRAYGYSYVYIAPQELLMQYLSMSLLAGAVVTLPVLLYEVWAFARPGFQEGENGLFLLAMVMGLVFFCLGVLFAYKILMPFMLYFLSSLGAGSEIAPAITVANYISFLLTVFVLLGVVFELPVLSVVLTWMGLMRPDWMRKGRRPMIVAIFVVAAIITPPEVVSQVMVAVPMLGLYELSIFLSSICWRLRGKKKKESA